MDIPRSEYPRPTFVREDWTNLNGLWEFEFDDADKGIAERWFESHSFLRNIVVPFTFESRLSGIGDTSVHEVVWYRRKFRMPDAYRGRRILLNFGAVDYKATVWINGELICEHHGGYTPFSCDITESLRPENVLVVRAQDTLSKAQPRGKQYWQPKPEGIYYTRATGIWQTVWIEPVSPFHLTYVRFYPDVRRSRVKVVVGMSGRNDSTQIRARFTLANDAASGVQVAETKLPAANDETAFEMWLKDPRLWSPDEPNLYNVILELQEDGKIHDRALAYFGMRSITCENGQVLLNGEPCRLRFVLDQGYFPDGVYTAPNDETFRRDVEVVKELGFNGVRKHQKIEDPRYYYWCDKLGLLVWGEMASSFEFNETSMANFAREWPHVIRANFNHPSIIAWVPFNESWGIEGVRDQDRPQEFVGQIAAYTRSLDPTRPVVDNSGWSHVDSDIVDLHEYSQDPQLLRELVAQVSPMSPRLPACSHNTPAMAQGFEYRGQPVIVSEYGGIALGSGAGWGYGQDARDAADLIARFRDLTEAITSSRAIAGYCYTQLYDVEQEVNGLLTFDRKPKAKAKAIAEVNQKQSAAAELSATCRP